MYDLIIIGGGPAGASAATFAGRAGLSTLVIDADKGLTRRAMLFNHLGFPEGITGPELVDRGREQAQRSGATWVEDTATALATNDDGTVTVTTQDGEYVATDVLLTVGASPSLAEASGIDVADGSEPRIAKVVATDPNGRTSTAHVWAAGTAGGVSVHTIVTAGDGARVAINIISDQKGERWVDHDVLPAPEA